MVLNGPAGAHALAPAHAPALASAHPPPTPKPATAAPAPAPAHARGAPRIHHPHPRPRIHHRTHVRAVPTHEVRARYHAQRALCLGACGPARACARRVRTCSCVCDGPRAHLLNAWVAHAPAPASAHPPPKPKPTTAAPAPAPAHARGAPRIHRSHPRPRIHRRTHVSARASTVPAHAVRARYYAQRALAAAPAVRHAHTPGACALVHACAMVRPTLRRRRVPPSRLPGVRVRRRGSSRRHSD
jgi:hypothetical protein